MAANIPPTMTEMYRTLTTLMPTLSAACGFSPVASIHFPKGRRKRTTELKPTTMSMA